ncbi:rwd domain protein [Diaporthe eres]|uniref:RWD domain-containing protein n=1 Tax=Diaporthe vaccinii TaxID=105482 RepID=A0ABR4F103_9PEZI|nr:rwd domain protein [Diaporthe eres]
MGREEQIEEREVLDSIFPDEITDASDSEYRIKITLDIPDDEENEQPVIVLTVRYPEDYPDKAPHLDLSAEDGENKHPLFNIADAKNDLLKSLEPVIEENLGMAMVFTLVTTVKEEAEQVAIKAREAQMKLREEAALEADRKENEKFQGNAVTRESFLSWREGFLKEMEEQRQKEEEERLAEMKKAKIKEPARMSGRQLWESGIAKGEEIDEGDDDAPAEDLAKLKVSAS